MKTIKPIMTFLAALLLFSGNTFAQDTTIVIKTSAICEQCKSKIENDLSFEKGIKNVNLDLKTKAVTVVYNSKKTSAENIRIAITKIGYDADNLPADVKAYQKLHKCCQKDVKH
jgi:mercuric ion binding protein